MMVTGTGRRIEQLLAIVAKASFDDFLALVLARQTPFRLRNSGWLPYRQSTGFPAA